MTFPAKILASIQRIGQSIHDAQREAASFANEQSRSVRSAMSKKGTPATEVEAGFADWKASVRLAHELKDINHRLIAIYATASGLEASREGVLSKGRKARKKGRRDTAPADPQLLRGNNAKLLTFLSGVIGRAASASVTQAAMAEGAGVPLGSVAYSVGRLIEMGLLEEGDTRGSYKLT